MTPCEAVMPPKKRKSLVERLEEQRLLWFILISILIHHTVLTVFFEPPVEPKDETRYEIVELETSPTEEDDPAAAAQVPVIPSFAVSADTPVPDEKKKAEAPQQTVTEEEQKKPEEKEKPPEAETAPADVIPTQGLHYVDIKSNESDKPPEKAKYFAPQNSIVDKETRA